MERKGKKEIIPPKRKRTGLREILDHGTHMALYNVATEFNLPQILEDSLTKSTRLDNIGMKIVMLAINKITSDFTIRSIQSWFSRSSLKERIELTSDDFTPKKVRGVLDLLSESKPDVNGIIEQTTELRELFYFLGCNCLGRMDPEYEFCIKFIHLFAYSNPTDHTQFLPGPTKMSEEWNCPFLSPSTTHEWDQRISTFIHEHYCCT